MWKFCKGFTTYITDHFQIIREKIELQNFLKYMHRNNNLKLRRTIVLNFFEDSTKRPNLYLFI